MVTINQKDHMIELRNDCLKIAFPEIHPDAVARIEFKRTLRIPDDGSTYPLPPGFRNFQLRHIEDYADKVPTHCLEKGGVMMPMYQSEALWLNFDGDYPMAVKIGTGKINAISGESWCKGLRRQEDKPRTWQNPDYAQDQDYLVIPEQPWLDGYCVERGVIRQFVAQPVGQGYTVEEQLKGTQDGGIQIEVFPLKAARWETILKKRAMRQKEAGPPPTLYCYASPKMGLAAGGRMKQEIYRDPYRAEDWDLSHSSRCWVHLINATTWESITGYPPPHEPASAKSYAQAGLPWFDYYSETPGISGSKKFDGAKTISEFPLDDENPFEPGFVNTIHKKQPWDDEELDEEPPF